MSSGQTGPLLKLLSSHCSPPQPWTASTSCHGAEERTLILSVTGEESGGKMNLKASDPSGESVSPPLVTKTSLLLLAGPEASRRTQARGEASSQEG